MSEETPVVESDSHDDNAAPSTVDDIAGSSPETEANTETVEASASGTEKAEKSNSYQQRMNQVTHERREAVLRAEAAEARLKTLESNQKPETTDLVAPNPDTFDTDQEYQTANAKYYADVSRQAVMDERVQDDKKLEQQTQQRTIEAEKAGFEEKVNLKREHFQDFEEVAYGHPYMDMDMARQVFKLENAPEVAYKIGLNGGEIAERISKLSNDDRIRELTKLDFQVEPLAPKKVSDAPDPISTLGSSEVIAVDEDKMSADEWREWRNKQVNG